ncbi:hypothetical protein [Dinghuibacter silviterrae]|uniref:Uncharacterized protein n=1 Tax=Dinghuibacter silviterrae TaxID=1539049 RepID=A0A4R8DVW0_9BACT|nr:hypothetical protein [Dinghuibacter silviterrae]TDX01351.1 hypothetical protein EDB95_2385 [Dinghuibacter silviterrae]
MKQEDVPQDNGALGKMTREVCYATDKEGKYVTELSTGWSVKTDALDTAWHEIEERVAKAREKVLAGEASPLLFFMERRLMDMPTLVAYTGFWKWRIKKDLTAKGFARLSPRRLTRYAEAFAVSVEDLKSMTFHED